MQANSGTVYPFYSDYPTITEYGKYIFTPQTDRAGSSNTFLKMDDTSYQWCGGLNLNESFSATYSREKLIIHSNTDFKGTWIAKEHESSRFSIKRCGGAETDPPLTILKVDKIS